MRTRQWTTAGVVAATVAALWAGGTATAQPAPPSAASPPPQPHIVKTFASGLRGPRAVLPDRRPSVPVRADVDGCDRNYGETAQCVPTSLPRGQTDLCAYLAAQGIRAPRVHTADARRVDGNRNGIACD